MADPNHPPALTDEQSADLAVKAEHRTVLRGLLGEHKPASDNLVRGFAESIRDIQQHQPNPQVENLFAANLHAWMGERAAPILTRLLAAEEERDLAIAHDRQPYPTAAAYEDTCAALATERKRADEAEARIEELSGQLPPAQPPPAYDPMPSIPRLLIELTQEEFWARYARVRGDAQAFSDDYQRARERTALLLRAVIADLFALAAPNDTHAVADAGRAANALRRVDRLGSAPELMAREWLREQYLMWERSPEPHPPNCPGRCDGTGQVMKILTWQDDGVPRHVEPVDCRRGEPEDPHSTDCVCHGTGRLPWGPNEVAVCDGPGSVPDPDPAPVPAYDDSWVDEPPF